MNYFNRLQDFFAGLDQPLQLTLLGLLILVFIFAFLLGWLLRVASIKRYKAQIMMLQSDQATFEARYKAAEEKQRMLAREVEQLSEEKVAAIDKSKALQSLLSQREDQEEEAREEGIVGNSSINWEETSVAYQEQIQLLQLEAEALKTALEQANQASQEVAASASTTKANSPATDTALAAMEVRLRSFEAQLEAIKRGEQVKEQATTEQPLRPFGTPHRPVVGTPAVAVDASGEPISIRADVTQAGERKNTAGQTEVVVDNGQWVIAPMVGASAQNEADDLQAIKHIGPFLEEKLRALGILSYAQIAAWSLEDIDDITASIGYLPGRIHLDNWVGQAKALLNERAPKPASSPEETAVPDNLKLVEGIGPKIEEVLHAHGIHDLKQLSETPANSLTEILAKAGSSYQMHDPSSWPAQAAQLLAKTEG